MSQSALKVKLSSSLEHPAREKLNWLKMREFAACCEKPLFLVEWDNIEEDKTYSLLYFEKGQLKEDTIILAVKNVSGIAGRGRDKNGKPSRLITLTGCTQSKYKKTWVCYEKLQYEIKWS